MKKQTRDSETIDNEIIKEELRYAEKVYLFTSKEELGDFYIDMLLPVRVGLFDQVLYFVDKEQIGEYIWINLQFPFDVRVNEFMEIKRLSPTQVMLVEYNG